MTTRVRYGVVTDVGRVRSLNEDAALASDGLFAVADGMGGHAAGEVASRLALETLRAAVTDDSLETLLAAVQQANAAVFQRSREDARVRGMGTTLCAVGLVRMEGHDRIAIINVGDSRVYLMQGGRLQQVTEDHSLVEAMVREGALTPEQARVHPQRNIVTRALGLDPEVGIDSWEVAPFAGDRYLLCSDGLFNEVSDADIAATLLRIDDPQEAAEQLVALANEAGGRDNITVVVVDILEDGEPGPDIGTRIVDQVPPPPPSPATGTDRGAKATGQWLDETVPPPPPDDGMGGRPVQLAAPAPRPAKAPLLTWRFAAFALGLVGIVGVAIGAIVWYGRGSYFVALDGDRVALFKGRPDGVLWIDPTLEKHYDLTIDDVPASRRDDLLKGQTYNSVADADAYVERLAEEAAELGRGPEAPSPTTVAGPTTSVTGAPGGSTDVPATTIPAGP